MRSGRDVLRLEESRAPLLEAVGSCDRLVLLGDILELRHGPVRDSLAVAKPVLGAIGDALGPSREVVIVPGNHDHHLLDGWLERRARDAPAPPPLALETDVDWVAGDPLARVAELLGPAEVRVSYPGIWLREDVYATHGHYLDRHTTVPMFERLGAGAMARLVREPADGPACAEDYEAILAPIYAWLHAIAQHGGPNIPASSHGPSARVWRALDGGGRSRSLRRRGLVAAFPALIAGLNRTPLGPLHADISAPELRRAALHAFSEVIARLGIDARQVVFGHTHRAGPLPADDPAEWKTPSGTQLLNTGCWVHEPSFLGSRPQESPYRSGFVATIDDQGPAELRNLLDGLNAAVPA